MNSKLFCIHEFTITGDFNIHLDDPLDSPSQHFTDLLSSTNLTQHVSVSTDILKHWTSLSLRILISLQQYGNLLLLYRITFLFSLTSTLHPPTPPLLHSKITFRRPNNTNIVEFNNDLASSDVILHPPASHELLDIYESTLRSILDKHAPLITKLSKPHKPNPWCTPALLAVKSARRHLNRKYISTHSASDYTYLRTPTNQYHKLIARAKDNSVRNSFSHQFPTHVFSGKT